MNQEQQFANTLEEIKRLAKNQGNCVGIWKAWNCWKSFRREKEKR